MNVLRILVLCLAASMVCVSLRVTHPQIASAVALAAGVAALLISSEDIRGLSEAVGKLDTYTTMSGLANVQLLKLCGIALVAEFASDICRDCGEQALAHRIESGVKLGMLAAALPTAVQLMERISELLP